MKGRKIIAVILNIAAVLIAASAAWMLHYNDFKGKDDAFNKVAYEDGVVFQEKFFAVAEAVINKINAGVLFETDGTIDLIKNIVKIDRGEFGGIMYYSTEDFIRYGKQIGIYLDSYNNVQEDGYELPPGDGGEGVLLWKIPGMDRSIEAEGSYLGYDEDLDGAIISMESLTFSILDRLGSYYKSLDIIEEDTNFKYRLAYGNETEEQYIYTNAPDQSLDELRGLKGKYIYNNINSIKLDSNLEVDWAQINEWVASNNFYDSSTYSLFMVVDTSYPVKTDFIYQSYTAYVKARQTFITGNLLLGLGLALACFTYLYLIYTSGQDLEDDKIILARFDKGPLEVNLLIWLVLIYLAQKGADIFFNQAYISTAYRQYTGTLASMITIYAIGSIALFSYIRRIKTGVFWKDSLIRKSIIRLNEYLKRGHQLFKLVLLFLLFCLLNVVIVVVMGKNIFISILIAVIFNGYILHIMLKKENDRLILNEGIYKIASGEREYQFPADSLHNEEKELAEHLNSINDGLKKSLEEQMKSERLKTDLITNVSHDIKTPLTSIINYVDLLKREPIEDPKLLGYIEVLDQKALRLKNLTDDLVEASKASSGNINLELMDIDLVELVSQTNGEFQEKFHVNGLQMVVTLPEEPLIIRADGRRMWRVLENLYSNVAKYGMAHTRVYIEVASEQDVIIFSIKNVSKYELNIQANELTERFVRGDISRNTEGSGLGLSIAKSLTTLQGGTFDLYIDGDLFKAMVIMPKKEQG